MLPSGTRTMDSSDGAARTTASWRPREAEAQFFAELLRESRLVLLYGEAGAGKTTLLEREVLPLLRLGFATDSRRETALIFNDWTEAPLSTLSAAIRLQLHKLKGSHELKGSSLAIKQT